LALLLPVLTYTIALFGFRLFDPLAAARQTVLAQIRAGVIVFDTYWRGVSLNLAAETMLGMRSGAARGKTWHALMPPERFSAAVPDAASHPAAEATALPEMSLGGGADARVCVPALTTLKDSRGSLIGHLLMLRDATAERRAQAQILEQQRALAVLEERERLARELHDGLG
jgi:signal transduction histidine kinase